MNIYHISWTYSDYLGLSAVVIAGNESCALKELDLDSSYNSKIYVHLMGVCTDGTKSALIACKESL